MFDKFIKLLEKHNAFKEYKKRQIRDYNVQSLGELKHNLGNVGMSVWLTCTIEDSKKYNELHKEWREIYNEEINKNMQGGNCL